MREEILKMCNWICKSDRAINGEYLRAIQIADHIRAGADIDLKLKHELEFAINKILKRKPSKGKDNFWFRAHRTPVINIKS